MEGHSAVNEAPITGEAMPAEKADGDHVYAGSIVHEGYLVVRSERDAGDTTLARMIRLIEEAERRRSPSERFVERFARYYTPAVTVGALLVVVIPVVLLGQPFSTWLLRGLTLLVIACPCALVISTPVSVVSAITSAARHGVLIKGGASLERMAEVQVVAFDKTGTLTHGRADVTDVLPMEGYDREHVLAVAAAVEARSEHPIARAIVRASNGSGEGFRVTEFESFPGQGAKARVDGVVHIVGRPSLQGDEYAPGLEDLAAAGKTPVVVLRAPDEGPRTLVALLGLTDPLRPAVPGVITRLRQLGIARVVVLSGDLRQAAEDAGREAGADDVWSRLEPAAKVEAVERLERQTGHVAMVGDGVNDAPALAAASVGIAMGAAASDAALETADIAVMGDDLARLPYLYRLARRSRRVIRENIAAALVVKLILAIGVPLGMGIADRRGACGRHGSVTGGNRERSQAGPGARVASGDSAGWRRGEDKQEEVDSHANRLLAKLRRIAVHGRILPTVSEVALVAVEHCEPALHEDTESLSGKPVVLVDLGEALGKPVADGIDWVIEGHVDQQALGGTTSAAPA